MRRVFPVPGKPETTHTLDRPIMKKDCFCSSDRDKPCFLSKSLSTSSRSPNSRGFWATILERNPAAWDSFSQF
ncbi:MAG: hypothetical protein BWY99_02660 [Synergistetes bacterium ADurb.BinA166]|nr:MAG: hypothetical protein BWY99_02660 [Synergistetes bacterium ADurb.BinA166]